MENTITKYLNSPLNFQLTLLDLFRDPMLADLIRTVKVRLDQMEEDEIDIQNDEDSSDEDSVEESLEESDDGGEADISDDDNDDNDINTDDNDSGVCVSD